MKHLLLILLLSINFSIATSAIDPPIEKVKRHFLSHCASFKNSGKGGFKVNIYIKSGDSLIIEERYKNAITSKYSIPLKDLDTIKTTWFIDAEGKFFFDFQIKDQQNSIHCYFKGQHFKTLKTVEESSYTFRIAFDFDVKNKKKLQKRIRKDVMDLVNKK